MYDRKRSFRDDIESRELAVHYLRWIAWALVAGTAAGGIAVALTRGDGQRVSLHLDEVSAQTLPDSFEVNGAYLSPRGRGLYWTANRPDMILDGPGGLQVLETDSLIRPIAAVLTEQDTIVEVVDSGRRSFLRLTLAGRFVAERPLQLPWRAESAIHSDSGWILGGRDVAGNYRVVRIGRSGTRKRLITIPARGRGGPRISMTLSAAGSEVYASLVDSPHVVTRIHGSATTRDSTRRRFPPPLLPRGSRGEGPLWISLAVHQLDTGYIRTFSDLRSDNRVLAIYDAQGNLLRSSRLSVPLAILGTIPQERALLALRRTDRLELVRYTWRWVGTSHQPEDV
jgi:hypothetical protein